MAVGVVTNAQVCIDPANVIYGLTNSGTIHPIDVNTGIAGPSINPAYTGNSPDLSNGIGYNQLNGKFYYFKRIPSSTIPEFFSFDPATNAYELLSSPATTNPVYSGSIAVDGLGYYCWDTQGTLFYYRFSNNTWTTISSNIKDQFGKDVDSIIRLHSSGDGAIDGYGNLWILPSSDSRFGLFMLSGPLPTTAVATLFVTQIVAMTSPPAKFVGIAFTATGEIFMSTSTDRLYRLESNLSLTLMSTISVSMSDLTSCNFPYEVLAFADLHFTAASIEQHVLLTWVTPMYGNAVYTIERSADNRTWNQIGGSSDFAIISGKTAFTDRAPLNGKSFYRLRITRANNNTLSIVRSVLFQTRAPFTIWPNPVTSNLAILSAEGGATVTIFSESGVKVKTTTLSQGPNALNVASLVKGKYVVNIRALDGSTTSYKLIKR